jgi:hypothetical protein
MPSIINSSTTSGLIATGSTDGSLALQTANTTALTISSGQVITASGSIGIGGTTPSSGIGIAFPATQSASSNANTLDDYEEGTWTPVATSQLGSLTSYTSSGAYTKIGNLVYVTGIITITNGGTASGVLFIAGYPFANGSSVAAQSGLAIEVNITGYSYNVRINSSSTNGFIGPLTTSAVVWTNTASYQFSLTYSA